MLYRTWVRFPTESFKHSSSGFKNWKIEIRYCHLEVHTHPHTDLPHMVINRVNIWNISLTKLWITTSTSLIHLLTSYFFTPNQEWHIISSFNPYWFIISFAQRFTLSVYGFIHSSRAPCNHYLIAQIMSFMPNSNLHHFKSISINLFNHPLKLHGYRYHGTPDIVFRDRGWSTNVS